MKKVGLIINPVAGIGGRAGLKGSDDPQLVAQAMRDGFHSEAAARMWIALERLGSLMRQCLFLSADGPMGGDLLAEMGLPYQSVYQPPVTTTAADTMLTARRLHNAGAELIIFAGGDGTARDLCAAVGCSLPVLGIPAGVKIHSGVFAITPLAGGEILRLWVSGGVHTMDAEVMDIDEAAFIRGEVRAKLYGYCRIPMAGALTQGAKTGAYSEEEALSGIAQEIVESMRPDTLYIISSGSTLASVMDALELPNTLLGVDAVMNKQLLKDDANEKDLLKLLCGCPAKIVVTAIGGQGHIFGRGNQPISPRVICTVGKENILVAATKQKLIGLRKGFVADTGSQELDALLAGYYRVITGYQEYMPFRCTAVGDAEERS